MSSSLLRRTLLDLWITEYDKAQVKILYFMSSTLLRNRLECNHDLAAP
jgi:hypothetical protein